MENVEAERQARTCRHEHANNDMNESLHSTISLWLSCLEQCPADDDDAAQCLSQTRKCGAKQEVRHKKVCGSTYDRFGRTMYRKEDSSFLVS
jgi:hypothetical protein